MVLLGKYFTSLQSRTGAQNFLLVRDDAQVASPDSSKKRLRGPPLRSTSGSNKSKGSHSKFEQESLDLKPPSPPLRMESQDDLCTGTHRRTNKSKRSSHPQVDSRFKSLFGTQIESSLNASKKNFSQTHRVEMNALANLAAPKFPVRQGSRDDLAVLPYYTNRQQKLAHRRLDSCSSTANQRIELSHIFDEVTDVLASGSSMRSQEELSQPVPFLSPYGSPDSHHFMPQSQSSERWRTSSSTTSPPETILDSQ